MTEEDVAAVLEVCRSGWLSMGPRAEAFAHDLAAYTSPRHALAVSIGTAALHPILLAAGVGAGGDVIVPTMTSVATVNMIAYSGAEPVFADIAWLERPWLTAAAAAAAIGPRTVAIVAVAYGGHRGRSPRCVHSRAGADCSCWRMLRTRSALDLRRATSGASGRRGPS